MKKTVIGRLKKLEMGKSGTNSMGKPYRREMYDVEGTICSCIIDEVNTKIEQEKLIDCNVKAILDFVQSNGKELRNLIEIEKAEATAKKTVSDPFFGMCCNQSELFCFQHYPKEQFWEHYPSTVKRFINENSKIKEEY